MDQDKLSDLRNYYDNENSVGGEDGVWEADTEDDPMVTTSIRLPKTLLDWVRTQADDQGIKPTALIRRWIEERNSTDHPRSLADRVDALEAAVFHPIGRPDFSWREGRLDQVGAIRAHPYGVADRPGTVAELLAAIRTNVADAVKSNPDQTNEIANDLRAVAEEMSRTA